MIRTFRAFGLFGLSLVLLVAAPTRAMGQQKAPAKATQTIVIHGQVPTPQVVTVRPREIPEYSRQQLGPARALPSFWASILPGYGVVAERQISGKAAQDSVMMDVAAGGSATQPPTDSASTPPKGATPMTRAQREAEIAALQSELARRRARLDSLARAVRGAGAREQTAKGLGAPPELPAQRDARAAARQAEIEALLKEVKYRRARLDSLELVVKNLGRPRTPTDSTRAPRDTTRAPRASNNPQKTSPEDQRR